jgi:hypothetical protein
MQAKDINDAVRAVIDAAEDLIRDPNFSWLQEDARNGDLA